MANYAYIENFQFIEIHDSIPKNWKNISNFSSFTDEEISQFGWYKLVKLIPEYNPETQKLGTERYYINENVAYETYDVIDLPPIIEPTPPTKEELDQAQWPIVRQIRDKLMSDFDWRYNRYEREVRLNITPTTDSIENMDTYMKALADITLQEDPFNIIWPTYSE